jgi:hypothetical protein
VSIEQTCREALGETNGLFKLVKTAAGIERRMRYETYSPNDIRAQQPYLSVSSCDELNAACDRFLASRGKLTGKTYSKHINKKHYEY